ncbi:MAG TPA: restriction endonuclease subunit S, partial [Cyclobacteriaceae bacterium]|nr:restriction endonuclease subunit S [Cyclobacteriaceae bacterium]
MSWKKIKLGELLTESRIPAIRPDTNKRIKVKLKVLGVEKRPIENEKEGATKQFERKRGQFIYGRQNFHKGAFGIVPDELDGFESSADLPAFDVRGDCLATWLFYFFKIGNRYLELEKLARGVGSKRIHPEQLSQIEIPLPSIEEQKHLISKFRRAETQSSEISNEFTHQLHLLKQLRQAFLREALQGKLVVQDLNDESGSELLTRIKTEKMQLIRERKIRKEKELPKIGAEEIPFEIPKNWTWCRLGEIALSISTGPFGTMLHKSDYVENGIPLVNPMNIIDERIVASKKMMINERTRERLSNYILKKDDIVLGRRGEMGRCAIVTEDENGWLCGTGSFFLRIHSVIDKQYFIK